MIDVIGGSGSGYSSGGGAADNVPKLVPTKSEVELASELKAEIIRHFDGVIEVMKKAHAHNLHITWDGIAPQAPTYQLQLIGLRVIKVL